MVGVRVFRKHVGIAHVAGEVARCLKQRYSMVKGFRADNGACLLTPRCRLKPQLAASRETFLAEFGKTSVATCAYPGLASGTPPA